MERRINKKIEDYISEFKDNVKQNASELGLTTDNSLSQLVWSASCAPPEKRGCSINDSRPFMNCCMISSQPRSFSKL